MSFDIQKIFGPNPAIQSAVSMAYEFSHVATYGDNKPHMVVFLNDNGVLKIPASHFMMGDYEEWLDPKVLPMREVARAASRMHDFQR